MSSIHLEVDIDSAMRELRRLDSGPPTAVVLELESVLGYQLAATKAVVHVKTGRLRNSGHPDSERTDTGWRGSVIYGNEVAYYAQMEQQRRAPAGGYPGGTHDFMEPIETGGRAYTDVLEAYLRGRL